MSTRHLSAVQQGQSQQHDVHAEACDTSLKETMNTTVEKDAAANDISVTRVKIRSGKDTIYCIVNTFSIFQIGC